MAGLPRSGSTMLSSILNQNPRFYSGPSSPVLGAMFAVEQNFMGNELYHGYPKPDQVREIIGSVPHHFYSDVNKPVVFDKNRAWTARVPYIEGYIGQQAKIIVPVRRVDEILTSILTMVHRNPFQEGQERVNFVDEQLIKTNTPINDYNRCMYLLNDGGIVYESLNAIMMGFQQNVRSKVKKTSLSPSSVLPEEILNLYQENKRRLEFWGTPDIITVTPKVKAPLVKDNSIIFK